MPEKLNWDERYARGDHPGPDPDPFLVRVASSLDEFLPHQGMALDLAGGAGSNAVHLAGLGFAVTLVDDSQAGLRKAEELAASRGVTLNTIAADLERGEYVLSENSFDLVAAFFNLHRPLFPAIRAAVKSGGLILYRTYTRDSPRPKQPAHALEHNELLEQFRDFRVLLYEELVSAKGIAAILARKF